MDGPATAKPATTAAELVALLTSSLDVGKRADRPKKTAHRIWGRDDIELTGWKFQDWAYSKKNSNLPTQARGLFTLGDKIVVRGYDKFFNVGELPVTSWESIEQNTIGPYYATLKENGCIVFLSGLEDGTLIVTSKHSTGPRADTPNERNHSWVAKVWVERHLASAGKTSEELARELYSKNATAVGELCDDSFEEHILPYTGSRAGIYLHGMNQNCPQFISAPWSDVSSLAHEYGFHETKYHTAPTLTSLKEFLFKCAETGSWGSEDVEGFVIRCKKVDGSDFFFKYKFEEPYLMYRYVIGDCTPPAQLHN
jgi:tRNA ligase